MNEMSDFESDFGLWEFYDMSLSDPSEDYWDSSDDYGDYPPSDTENFVRVPNVWVELSEDELKPESESEEKGEEIGKVNECEKDEESDNGDHDYEDYDGQDSECEDEYENSDDEDSESKSKERTPVLTEFEEDEEVYAGVYAWLPWYMRGTLPAQYQLDTSSDDETKIPVLSELEKMTLKEERENMEKEERKMKLLGDAQAKAKVKAEANRPSRYIPPAHRNRTAAPSTSFDRDAGPASPSGPAQPREPTPMTQMPIKCFCTCPCSCHCTCPGCLLRKR